MDAGAHEAILLADDNALLLEGRNRRPGGPAELEADEAGSLGPGPRRTQADLTHFGAVDQPGSKIADACLDVFEANAAHELSRAALHAAAQEVGVAVLEA